MSFKKALLGLAMATAVSVGCAQDITQDVGIERFFGSEKFKAKNGGAQLSLTSIVYYWHISMDIGFLKKLKGEALVSYYLSADEVVSPDDTLVYQKPTNGLKVIKPKVVKLKVNLGPQHKGQFLIGTVVSPQSQIEFNDQTVYQIPTDAY